MAEDSAGGISKRRSSQLSMEYQSKKPKLNRSDHDEKSLEKLRQFYLNSKKYKGYFDEVMEASSNLNSHSKFFMALQNTLAALKDIFEGCVESISDKFPDPVDNLFRDGCKDEDEFSVPRIPSPSGYLIPSSQISAKEVRKKKDKSSKLNSLKKLTYSSSSTVADIIQEPNLRDSSSKDFEKTSSKVTEASGQVLLTEENLKLHNKTAGKTIEPPSKVLDSSGSSVQSIYLTSKLRGSVDTLLSRRSPLVSLERLDLTRHSLSSNNSGVYFDSPRSAQNSVSSVNLASSPKNQSKPVQSSSNNIDENKVKNSVRLSSCSPDKIDQIPLEDASPVVRLQKIGALPLKSSDMDRLLDSGNDEPNLGVSIISTDEDSPLNSRSVANINVPTKANPVICKRKQTNAITKAALASENKSSQPTKETDKELVATHKTGKKSRTKSVEIPKTKEATDEAFVAPTKEDHMFQSPSAVTTKARRSFTKRDSQNNLLAEDVAVKCEYDPTSEFLSNGTRRSVVVSFCDPESVIPSYDSPLKNSSIEDSFLIPSTNNSVINPSDIQIHESEEEGGQSQSINQTINLGSSDTSLKAFETESHLFNASRFSETSKVNLSSSKKSSTPVEDPKKGSVENRKSSTEENSEENFRCLKELKNRVSPSKKLKRGQRNQSKLAKKGAAKPLLSSHIKENSANGKDDTSLETMQVSLWESTVQSKGPVYSSTPVAPSTEKMNYSNPNQNLHHLQPSIPSPSNILDSSNKNSAVGINTPDRTDPFALTCDSLMSQMSAPASVKKKRKSQDQSKIPKVEEKKPELSSRSKTPSELKKRKTNVEVVNESDSCKPKPLKCAMGLSHKIKKDLSKKSSGDSAVADNLKGGMSQVQTKITDKISANLSLGKRALGGENCPLSDRFNDTTEIKEVLTKAAKDLEKQPSVQKSEKNGTKKGSLASHKGRRSFSSVNADKAVKPLEHEAEVLGKKTAEQTRDSSKAGNIKKMKKTSDLMKTDGKEKKIEAVSKTDGAEKVISQKDSPTDEVGNSVVLRILDDIKEEKVEPEPAPAASNTRRRRRSTRTEEEYKNVMEHLNEVIECVVAGIENSNSQIEEPAIIGAVVCSSEKKSKAVRSSLDSTSTGKPKLNRGNFIRTKTNEVNSLVTEGNLKCNEIVAPCFVQIETGMLSEQEEVKNREAKKLVTSAKSETQLKCDLRLSSSSSSSSDSSSDTSSSSCSSSSSRSSSRSRKTPENPAKSVKPLAIEETNLRSSIETDSSKKLDKIFAENKVAKDQIVSKAIPKPIYRVVPAVRPHQVSNSQTKTRSEEKKKERSSSSKKSNTTDSKSTISKGTSCKKPTKKSYERFEEDRKAILKRAPSNEDTGIAGKRSSISNDKTSDCLKERRDSKSLVLRETESQRKTSDKKISGNFTIPLKNISSGVVCHGSTTSDSQTRLDVLPQKVKSQSENISRDGSQGCSKSIFDPDSDPLDVNSERSQITGQNVILGSSNEPKKSKRDKFKHTTQDTDEEEDAISITTSPLVSDEERMKDADDLMQFSGEDSSLFPDRLDFNFGYNLDDMDLSQSDKGCTEGQNTVRTNGPVIGYGSSGSEIKTDLDLRYCSTRSSCSQPIPSSSTSVSAIPESSLSQPKPNVDVDYRVLNVLQQVDVPCKKEVSTNVRYSNNYLSNQSELNAGDLACDKAPESEFARPSRSQSTSRLSRKEHLPVHDSTPSTSKLSSQGSHPTTKDSSGLRSPRSQSVSLPVKGCLRREKSMSALPVCSSDRPILRSTSLTRRQFPDNSMLDSLERSGERKRRQSIGSCPSDIDLRRRGHDSLSGEPSGSMVPYNESFEMMPLDCFVPLTRCVPDAMYILDLLESKDYALAEAVNMICDVLEQTFNSELLHRVIKRIINFIIHYIEKHSLKVTIFINEIVVSYTGVSSVVGNGKRPLKFKPQRTVGIGSVMQPLWIIGSNLIIDEFERGCYDQAYEIYKLLTNDLDVDVLSRTLQLYHHNYSPSGFALLLIDVLIRNRKHKFAFTTIRRLKFASFDPKDWSWESRSSDKEMHFKVFQRLFNSLLKRETDREKEINAIDNLLKYVALLLSANKDQDVIRHFSFDLNEVFARAFNVNMKKECYDLSKALDINNSQGIQHNVWRSLIIAAVMCNDLDQSINLMHMASENLAYPFLKTKTKDLVIHLPIFITKREIYPYFEYCFKKRIVTSIKHSKISKQLSDPKVASLVVKIDMNAEPKLKYRFPFLVSNNCDSTERLNSLRDSAMEILTELKLGVSCDDAFTIRIDYQTLLTYIGNEIST